MRTTPITIADYIHELPIFYTYRQIRCH